MVTVLTWGNSEGTKGRCDARCHNAAAPECRCMCGGSFHGVSRRAGGLERSIREEFQKVADAAKERAGKEGFDLKVAMFQKSLDGYIVLPATPLYTPGQAEVLLRASMEPVPYDDLQGRTGITPRGTRRVLNALKGRGLMSQDDLDRWSLTEKGIEAAGGLR